jgi:ABC-2 type transport system permease protein
MMTADTPNSGPDGAPAAYPFSRIMGWCLRREIWENRSIWIAPAAAAGLLISTLLFLVLKLLTASGHIEVGPKEQGGDFPTGEALWIPYAIVAGPVLAMGLLVAIAYCLGALHGERRDRSILFWKSLPVSDLTAVLSKAGIPILAIPLISCLAAIVAQLATFAIVLLVFPMLAAKAHLLWMGVPVDYHTVGKIAAGVPVLYLTFGMLYAVLATALWHAPIYAWLLLVGGWARRMAVLWAVAPLGGLIIVERIAFGSQHLFMLLQHRLQPPTTLAVWGMPNDMALPILTPGHFLAAPGLWGGLAVAALFLAGAVLLRRYRQPI